MKNILVSIIIPVRNAEKYIEKCIESVRLQTHTAMEIILVLNDSSDRSESKCKQLASVDSRIRIIVSGEPGVSKARNIGIDSALGGYIMFIDADDYIDKELVQRLYTEINEHDVQIATAHFEKYDIHALGTSRVDKFKNRIVTTYDYAQKMLLGVSGYSGYAWGKLYRVDFLSDVRFDETLAFSEDTDFLNKLFRQDMRIYVSPFVGYFYSQDTSGITKDTSGNDRLKALSVSETFVNEANDTSLRSAAACYYWRNAYYILSQSNLSSQNQSIVWKLMRKYRISVIVNGLSPLKYRLIALSSLVGRRIFMNNVLAATRLAPRLVKVLNIPQRVTSKLLRLLERLQEKNNG